MKMWLISQVTEVEKGSRFLVDWWKTPLRSVRFILSTLAGVEQQCTELITVENESN